MAALGLHCCAWAFSSCSERGLLLTAMRGLSHCGGFACCGARALGTRASVVVAHGLSSCGLRALERRLSSCGTRAVAPWHVGSSQTRARTRVPCFGRRILNHCATREVPVRFFKKEKLRGKGKYFQQMILTGTQGLRSSDEANLGTTVLNQRNGFLTMEFQSL